MDILVIIAALLVLAAVISLALSFVGAEVESSGSTAG